MDKKIGDEGGTTTTTKETVVATTTTTGKQQTITTPTTTIQPNQQDAGSEKDLCNNNNNSGRNAQVTKNHHHHHHHHHNHQQLEPHTTAKGQSSNHHQSTVKSNSINKDSAGKENQSDIRNEQRFCFECNRSLAKSRHFINIAGQMHRWHPECFKCNVCNEQLDRENSCHFYKQKIVCREDYAKIQRDNSIKCSRCRWPISPSDWVRKAGQYVYHLACFSCDICLRQLSTGEQFTISIQEKNIVRLLCRLHFAIESTGGPMAPITTDQTRQAQLDQSIVNSSSSSSSPPPPPPPPSQNLPFDFNYTTANNQLQPSPQQQTSRQVHHSIDKFQQPQHSLSHQDHQYLQMLASTSVASTSGHHLEPHSQQHQALSIEFQRKEFELEIGQQQQHLAMTVAEVEAQQLSIQRASATSTSSSNGSTSGAGSGLMGIPSKSKRVRTTFTEDQLSILQTHFQIDSNPDGQDLERIATITGLSKRVTQVWFQNSRARQKKYMIKRKPSAGTSSGGSAVTTAAASIGLAANQSSSAINSSVASKQMSFAGPGGGVGQQQQQQHHHHHPQMVGSSTYQQQDDNGSGHQSKLSGNMSDQSELSLDGANDIIEDMIEEDSRSSSCTDNDHLLGLDEESN